MKVEIKKLDNFGRGIGYIDDKICFFNNTFPGDIIEGEIVDSKKKFLIGKVISYYKKSEDRITPKCIYADVCGGCVFQSFDFSKENEFKLEKVKDILKKFGNVEYEKVKEIVYDKDCFYRNKIVLHGDCNGVGYYRENSNEIVYIDKCLVADKKINEIICVLKNIKCTDKYQVLIRVSNDSNSAMISIDGDVSNYYYLKDYCDSLIINGKIVHGNKNIISSINSKNYCVSSKSFFQVNKSVTKLLYDEVKEIVSNIKPRRVLDLYCGTGTIGLYICNLVDSVIGVEMVDDAIDDAIKNALLNNDKNIKFILGKVENVIDQLKDADMIIVDPPRAGLDTNTINNIKRIMPKNLVYVSCDPVTLGRDIKEFSDIYDVLYVKAFNMFPRSYHVECVCVLNRR